MSVKLHAGAKWAGTRRSADSHIGRAFLVLFLLSSGLSAQTAISGWQIRNVFNPVPVLPSACAPYSVYLLTTTNTPYICTAANTLTPLSAGAGSGLPTQASPGGYLYSDGANLSWGNIITGGSEALDCVTIPGQCDIVTAVVPRLGAVNLWTGANDFSSAPFIRVTTGAGIPDSSTCASANHVGKLYVRSDAQAVNASVYSCDQTGPGVYSWELLQSAGSGTVSTGSSQINGPGWLFGEPNGACCSYTAAFLFSENNLTIDVWPVNYAMTTSNFGFYLHGSDAGKYLGAAYYDHSGTLVCSSSPRSLTTGDSYAVISWSSPCSFSDASGGWVALASNSDAVTIMSNTASGVGFWEGIANSLGTAYVGTAANPAAINNSTITWPASLGAITPTNNAYPVIFRN